MPLVVVPAQWLVKSQGYLRLVLVNYKILIEASALFLFSQRNPMSLVDDDRLSYQIGIAILRLAEQFS